MTTRHVREVATRHDFEDLCWGNGLRNRRKAGNVLCLTRANVER